MAQAGWVALLWPQTSVGVTFVWVAVLLLVELAGPVLAETRHGGTPWHPHHIAERYGLLVIIALGEGLLGTAVALTALIGPEGPGWSLDVVVLGLAGTALTFGMWWIYFILPMGGILARHRERVVRLGLRAHRRCSARWSPWAPGCTPPPTTSSTTASSAPPARCSRSPSRWRCTSSSVYALHYQLARVFDPFHLLLLAGTAVVVAASVAMAAAGTPMVWCLAVLALAPVGDGRGLRDRRLPPRRAGRWPGSDAPGDGRHLASGRVGACAHGGSTSSAIPRQVLTLDEVEQPTPGAGPGAGQGAGGGAELPRRPHGQGMYQEKPPLPLHPRQSSCAARSWRPASGSSARRPAARAPSPSTRSWTPTPPGPVPEGMSDEKAASLYLTYQTGYVGLHRRAHLQAGEWLLVHAGAGGVGHGGDPARQGGRREGHRHRRRRAQGRGLPRARRRPRHRLHVRGLRPGRQGGHRRARRRRRLRPGRRRRLRQVAQVHRVRGPARRRRVHQRPHPRGAGQPPAGQELQRRRPALGPVPEVRRRPCSAWCTRS